MVEIKTQEAASIFELIASGPRPYKLVEFPKPHPETGDFYDIAIRPLNHKEMGAMLRATAQYVKKQVETFKLDPNAPEVETIRRNRSVIETLFRACRDPKDLERPAFPIPDLLEYLEDSVLEILLASYQRVDFELGQKIGEMTQKDLDDWIDALVQGGQATAENFFDRASSLSVVQLLSALVSRLAKQNSDTNSSSSRPSESNN